MEHCTGALLPGRGKPGEEGVRRCSQQLLTFLLHDFIKNIAKVDPQRASTVLQRPGLESQTLGMFLKPGLPADAEGAFCKKKSTLLQ